MIATSFWESVLPLLVLLPFGLPGALFVYILATALDEPPREETAMERLDRLTERRPLGQNPDR